MDTNKFINSKLDLLLKDKDEMFSSFAEQLRDPKTPKITVDQEGNFFKCRFRAISPKSDYLIIEADRKTNGIYEGRYIVEFHGTRAAYLRAEYNYPKYPIKFNHVSWDIRSYANHPDFKDKRIRVNGFYAHNELRLMLQTMQFYKPFDHVYNKYIADNALRIQLAISGKRRKEDQQQAAIESELKWSQGLMESLGFKNVEVLLGINNIHSHWWK